MRTTLRISRAAMVFTAIGALALTGCSDSGSGKDKSNKSPGNDKGSPASVALPKLDGEKLSVAAVWTGAEQANFVKVLKEFERRTGATVTFVPAQDPIVNFLGTKIAGGQPPDVAMIPQVGAIRQAAEKKWAKPVGAEAQAQLTKNYGKVWQDLGAVDGTQYGVYFKAANKSLIWYNAKAFENAGAAEPKTWKEFLATAEAVSASGVTPVSVGGADGWTLTDWFENIYLSQAGPEKYDQLAQHEIKWTDPSVKDALTTLAQLFGKPSLIAGGADGALQTEFPASVTQTFTGGDQPKAAMVYEGDFVAVTIAQTKAKIGTDAKVFPFPAVGAESPVVTGGDAAVALKDGKGAQALLTWLGSTDAAKIMAEQGGFLSPNKALDAAAYPNEVQRTMAKALIAAGDAVRFDMSDQAPQSFGGTPGKGEWKTLQDFLKNPKDIAGTQAKLESDAAKAYKS
ncbi:MULTISPECIES: ABC transporter substrate-binding protein [unclassified Streptomyces]|uniref:ABC transporter substrate-binding protein n=1 Tax=unclassified Streptomyces TaxID=2593676 RepID=UPI002252F28A|nr:MULTISPECIES: ABC transporter substrate-binding protein [unclassified Streptomyces]WSP55379.1 ABC transporter substrate-binding protein [Streptomyces sp. NBC_01241]WSU23891.1 ABC transporter substrate-binding protein [Streptomyces sp. NBC_01108]MCX4787059.1 ABC transporter substrate-binding protein [Streptomyces sp. NBC_01221]MCX4797159.1 ABC transporter substrate-binding protein [Streptomyces sp. NBC_01242]WSJ38455.1 ABC transporter substrate-binding protein [Streptomyces sp. NBC_01321]